MIPTAKVLRDGSIDAGHAKAKWQFTLDQRCDATGELMQCTYTYHEMPDGRIWELTTVDGELIEHSSMVVCDLDAAWRVGPVDRGARLLAAAKAQVTQEQHRAALAPALRVSLASVIQLPESADGMFLNLMQQAASVAATGSSPSVASLTAIVEAAFSPAAIGSFLGLNGLIAGGIGSLAVGEPCYTKTFTVWASALAVVGLLTLMSGSDNPVQRTLLGASVLVTYGIAIGNLVRQFYGCKALYDAAVAAQQIQTANLILSTASAFIAASIAGVLTPWVAAVATGGLASARAVFTWWGEALPPGFGLFTGDWD
jgi:hypothetical protein